ncbi:hypothetical protein [Kitasatospora sp. NPDC057015]|uniref:hypothetical protein n=1 Tax=Kitasatospora sp. NPDC057015 TaxID=3346001 RepID=UPI0036291FE4
MVVVEGFEPAVDAAGPRPAVTVTLCESHRGAADGWLDGFRPVVRPDAGTGQRCGWVHDFRAPEVVLRAHVDSWLGRLSGLDLADDGDWAAYLSAAHERLCRLHGLEPGHIEGNCAVTWIGLAASERDGGGLGAALAFLADAEMLAAAGRVSDGPDCCC